MPSPCFWSFVHWHVTPGCSSGTPSLQLPLAPSLDCCTSVPRHAAQVARPWFCELFKLGVPRLGSQVAHLSDFLGLACHTFDTKWHAIVKVLLGMESWRATPLCSSGTPIVVDESGVPRPAWRATPLLCPPLWLSEILYQRATPSLWRATPICML
ncbi:uncharacterized protein DS421_17g587730 [Arachis hypogaea]|nr:uncharacterized protein DS421_17g587730 [Arachis hypogaea]